MAAEIAGVVVSAVGLLASPFVQRLCDRLIGEVVGRQNEPPEIGLCILALLTIMDGAERELDQLDYYQEVNHQTNVWAGRLKDAISLVEERLDAIEIYRLTQNARFQVLDLTNFITTHRQAIDIIIRGRPNRDAEPVGSTVSNQLRNGGHLRDLWPEYKNLPFHLKRCFMLLSIFPQDHALERDSLVHLWMALDFIQNRENETLEDTGRRYFDEELQTFIQNLNGTSCYHLRAPFYELGNFASRRECRRLEGLSIDTSTIPTSVSHLLSTECENFSVTFDDLAGVWGDRLRTIIHTKIESRRNNQPQTPPASPQAGAHIPRAHVNSRFSVFGQCFSAETNVVIRGFTGNRLGLFKRLRVLDVSCGCCIEVPESIGGLKLLRLLNLSKSRIKHLPKTVCDLGNLLILKLDGCRYLKSLPCLKDLVKLLHLFLPTKCPLKSLPKGIEKLTNLKTFSGPFVVGRGNGKDIAVLKKMNKLRGSLWISNLENVQTFEDASEAKLDQKGDLCELKLQWSINWKPHENYRFDEVLGGLKPHSGLHNLKISSYGGSIFPHWVTNNSFPHLEKLVLKNCTNLREFDAPPSVKSLKIECCPLLVDWFDQQQQHSYLHTLKISGYDGSIFPRWVTSDSFPHLEKLMFKNCTNLREFDTPPSVKSLKIECCRQLVDWINQQQPQVWRNEGGIYRRI